MNTAIARLHIMFKRRLRLKGSRKPMVAIGSVFLCVFGWMYVGGIDGEPPKDDDLLIPEATNNVPPCDNAFVAITNLAHLLDSSGCSSVLPYYIDPVSDLCCYGEDCDNFEPFMSEDLLCKIVEAEFTSNKTEFAFYDHAAACETFLPPPINEYDPLADEDYSITDLVEFFRTILPARIKLAAQKGEFAKAVSLFKNDVEFARRMSENPGTFVEYLVAECMSRNAVEKMARTVREYDFPDMELQEVNDIIASAGQDNKFHFINALKREYMVIRHNIKSNYVLDCLGWNSDNFISQALARFVARYAFHPNKALSKQGDMMRTTIAKVNVDKWTPGPCRKKTWYSFLLPNHIGDIMLFECNGYADSCLRKAPLQLLAARVQIAMIRYSRKHGRDADTIERLAEFLGDYPQSLLGESVEIDLKERKVKCGEYSVDIEIERIRNFPFVKKDGRIMTNDGKTVMALEDVEELNTDELDNHADSVNYDDVKTLIVGSNYTNECEWGTGIFRLCPSLLTESKKLHEVVVPSNHSLYAVSKGVVYLKNYGCMIRCLAGRESVGVPACVKEVTPRAFQYCPDLKAIVFSGPLPRIYRRKDSIASRLSDRWDKFLYWCRYRTKYNWERIFKAYRPEPLLSRTAKDCVTIVMDESADPRTRECVKKGEWEGRKIISAEQVIKEAEQAHKESVKLIKECEEELIRSGVTRE